MRFNALVLTFNEEAAIGDCLGSLESAERIAVVDSGSTDGTLDVLRTVPRVEVWSRPFTDFADQRNEGVRHFFSEGEWVLHLDADERLTPELADELKSLEPGPHAVAFNISSRTFLRGQPVLRASAFPVYQTRLTRAGHFQFHQVGHGQKAPPGLGSLPCLNASYDHFPFEKGRHEWEQRHRRYASQEAEALAADGGRWTLPAAGTDSIAKRQWLKHASARVPGRAHFIWLYLMFVRRGVLDGPAGWSYCGMRWRYERMVNEALRRRRKP